MPIRAGIQRVLRLAPRACTRADLTRGLRQILPGAEAVPDDDEALATLMDIALFEPNQRDRRVFDSFLAGRAAAALEPPDRALAERTAAARFSLFRVAGRHPAAGLWLEDLLAEDTRLWLLDKGLEASAREGMAIGLRLFDAGPFHAGFGIIVQPDDFTLATCRAAAARGAPMPFRQSLAATLYGDKLRERLPPDGALIEVLASLLDRAPAGPPRLAGAARRPVRRPASPRRRR